MHDVHHHECALCIAKIQWVEIAVSVSIHSDILRVNDLRSFRIVRKFISRREIILFI